MVWSSMAATLNDSRRERERDLKEESVSEDLRTFLCVGSTEYRWLRHRCGRGPHHFVRS
jgi:hypothetical protein